MQPSGSIKVSRARLIFQKEEEKSLHLEPVQEVPPENKVVKVETSKPIAQEVE